MSLPSSSLTSLTFSVSTGSPPNVVTYEHDIPLSSVNMGSNSILIPTTSSIFSAFETASVGTAFSHSLQASHVNGLSVVTTNGAQPFVIPPPPPPPPIVLGANGVTVQYTLPAISTGPNPTFVQANLRGTGSEWFAVVDQTFNQTIMSYANQNSGNYAAAVATFTPPGQSSPVIFNNIVTTLMTDMSYMFYQAYSFNQPIGSWDTSSVITMNNMFQFAFIFNQDISNWNVSNVIYMSFMFMQANSFNGDISNWNVSNVTRMDWMFYQTYSFNNNGNPNIGNWYTYNVTNMSTMFHDALVFNQNISMWNVYNVSNHNSFNGGASGLNPLYIPNWVYP